MAQKITYGYSKSTLCWHGISCFFVILWLGLGRWNACPCAQFGCCMILASMAYVFSPILWLGLGSWNACPCAQFRSTNIRLSLKVTFTWHKFSHQFCGWGSRWHRSSCAASWCPEKAFSHTPSVTYAHVRCVSKNSNRCRDSCAPPQHTYTYVLCVHIYMYAHEHT